MSIRDEINEKSHEGDAVRRAALGIAGFARRALIAPTIRWRRRRATMYALSALDDRMLADIGIRRSDIEQVVRGRLPRRLDDVAPAIRTATGQAEPVPEMKRAA